MTARALAEHERQLARLIEDHGLEVAWQSALSTHSNRLNPVFLGSILRDLPLARNDAPDLFEQLSLPEIGVLYEFGLAYADKDARRLAGQYFTPDDVAAAMAAEASTFPDGVWLDPCCGVGNLVDALIAIQPAPADFLRSNIKLVDRDPLALQTASILLSLRHGPEVNLLYQAVRANAVCADALHDALPGFDFVLMNPPYVATQANPLFESSRSRDLYAYFLELFAKKSRGFVAITPQSFTSATKDYALREVLRTAVTSLVIYCFDNVPDTIFRGIKHGSTNTNRTNSTRAAITVARKFGSTKELVTPLLRWRASERQQMFQSMQSFLSPIQWHQGSILKVSAPLLPLYQAVKNLPPVSDYVAEQPTQWGLQVPLTPRYFLSATRRDLSRGQSMKLWFKSEAAAESAYVLLNSSVAYWWWRICDGGITLKRETLLSVPWLTAPSPGPLIRRLEESEEANLVSKLNAGRVNENVKHSVETIRLLNAALVGRYGSELLLTHLNSVLVPPDPTGDGVALETPKPTACQINTSLTTKGRRP